MVAVARSVGDLQQLAGDDTGIVPVAADLADDAAITVISDALDGPVRIVVQAAGLPASGTIDTITRPRSRAGSTPRSVA